MNAYFPTLLSGKYLPQRCAGVNVPGGRNVSPSISWGEIPEGTLSFAIRLVDRHPSMDGWVYWYVVNIPAEIREIREKSSGLREGMPEGSLEMRNSFGDLGYKGPAVQPGSEAHPVELVVYALSVPSLSLGPYAMPEERDAALRSVLLASASANAVVVPA
jgi:Raf kinase inhibitor-like YbhB/YbcL family protein